MPALHTAVPLEEVDHVARAVREWQGDIGALVAEQGASKRVRARLLAVGVNGLGAALIIFLFASTGGLTGAEVGVAGGASLLAQSATCSIPPTAPRAMLKRFRCTP